MAHTNTIGPLKTSGYRLRLPTFDEVVSNAININRYPVPTAPQQLNLSGSNQLLLTFMNFTCNGTITKLTYIGQLRPSHYDDTSGEYYVTTWPYFSLWHRQFHEPRDYFEETHGIGPSNHSQLSITHFNINEVNAFVEVNVNLATNVTFKEGDILGVRMQQTITSGSFPITVLKQEGGYGLTRICDHQNAGGQCSEMSDEIQEIPYISVGTSKTSCHWKTNIKLIPV